MASLSPPFLRPDLLLAQVLAMQLVPPALELARVASHEALLLRLPS
jgi:hypothetical protein